MTDKQIIIDVYPYQGECSVSGCKRNDDGCFVRQLFEERNRAENRIVELNKMIKAKEQEFETLASQLDFEVQKKECLEQECERLRNNRRCAWKSLEGTLYPEAQEQLDQLKGELTRANCQIADDEILQCDMREAIEELKAENNKLKEEKQGLIKDWEEKKNLAYEIACKNEKLKQTLTEIKEIAEICKCHNADGCYECKYFDDCEIEDEEIPTRDVCKLILQKISEVEDD